MKAAWKRLRENYILLWLFIGLGLVSFTAGMKVHEQMSYVAIDQFEDAVKEQVAGSRMRRGDL